MSIRRSKKASAHPLAARLGGSAASPPKALSHDRRNSDARVVDASQRWRLLAATANVIATHGYASATIDKITARAGVTKKTFYKFFDSKDDAFLASYEAVDALIDRVVGAGTDHQTPLERLRTIISTYLAGLAAVPDLTAMFLFEALAASPRIRRQRAAYIEKFADGFLAAFGAERKHTPALPQLTRADVLLLLGGINELCVLHLTRHDASTLPGLEDAIFRGVLRFLSGQATS